MVQPVYCRRGRYNCTSVWYAKRSLNILVVLQGWTTFVPQASVVVSLGWGNAVDLEDGGLTTSKIARNLTSRMHNSRDVTEPAKIHIHSCAKSVGCGFVVRSKVVPAVIATAIELSYLKLNSYKQTSSE